MGCAWMKSVVGILVYATMVISVFALACGGHAFNKSKYNRAKAKANEDILLEVYFISTTISMLVVSTFIYLIGCLFTIDIEQDYVKIGLSFYHIIGALMVLSAGACMIASACEIEEEKECKDATANDPCQSFLEKIIGGALQMVNAIPYFTTGLIIFKGKMPVPV